jgi:hypothetical protein
MAKDAVAYPASIFTDPAPRRFGAGSTFGGSVQASITWIKSRRCEANACVEVAYTGDEVLVRSSANEAGPILRFTPAEWVAFIGGVRDGDFDFGLVDERGTSAN